MSSHSSPSRSKTPDASAPEPGRATVTTKTPWWKYKPMAGPPLRVPSREGIVAGLVQLVGMLFYFATFIGAAYVVIHFIAKYW